MSRRLFLLFAGVVFIGVFLAACGGGASSNGGASSAASGAAPLNVTETATEFKFDPPTINAAPGQTINLTLKNDGSVRHIWVLSQAGVNLMVNPGQTATATFTAPTAPGSYQFECDLPGHKESGMVGQLIVK